jgi:hypothetical protein
MSKGAAVDPDAESLFDEGAAGDSSAGALALALLPVQPASSDQPQAVTCIRIGPSRHGFVYEYTNGAWVCRRGSEWANGMERLVRN